MAKMEWTDSLSVGIGLIDSQHKTWIDRLGKVHDEMAAHNAIPQIVKALNFLAEYTEYHFGTEERHMAQLQYPGLEAHKAKHEELKGTLANLIQEFEEEGAHQKLADYVDNLLVNWLTQHIQNVDQQFGAFIKEKGITLPEE